jgi:hypothetical protein
VIGIGPHACAFGRVKGGMLPVGARDGGDAELRPDGVGSGGPSRTPGRG